MARGDSTGALVKLLALLFFIPVLLGAQCRAVSTSESVGAEETEPPVGPSSAVAMRPPGDRPPVSPPPGVAVVTVEPVVMSSGRYRARIGGSGQVTGVTATGSRYRLTTVTSLLPGERK